MSTACFVTKIELSLAEKLREGLLDQHFVLTQPPYTILQGKKRGICCTLYTSGKLTVQGKDKEEFILYYLEPEILKKTTYSYPEKPTQCVEVSHIGVDESGKGDVFGPLCVCAVYVEQGDIQLLAELKIRDSKRMNDREILRCAKKLKQHYAYDLLVLFPKKYNQLYASFLNLNTLLGWGHATVIKHVVEQTECRQVTIDQFAKKEVVTLALFKKKIKVELNQKHRGEEDPVVAAASVIARAAFIESLKRLEDRFLLPLPKGASPSVTAAIHDFIRKHGREHLQEVSKVHFKTVRAILQGEGP